MRYYQENTGDYLAINPSSRVYYVETFGLDQYEGRATAITGLVTSVCTTGVSRKFLQEHCRPVLKADVPAEWLEAIG